jgi:preprotein translocase subunit YajC
MISTLLFIAQAAPGQTGAGSLLSTPIVPIVCFIVIFYVMVIRPQSKQRKDLQTLVSTLKTGDKVVTSGGIHGIIANVKEGTTLILKIADNVKIEVDKSAIANVDKGTADNAPATVKS